MRINTETDNIICKTEMASGRSENIGIYAVASTVNGLMAEGGREICVSAHLLLPEKLHKPYVYAIEKQIKRVCREKQITLLEIRESVQSQVSEYTVIVTGLSRAPKEEAWYRETMRAGQDIVLTKWIGLEGMLQILSERREELKERFASGFLRQAAEFEAELFASEEIEAARENGASLIMQIGEGGVFAALWRLAEKADTGLEADMKKMSIRQETVEVCEHFRLNPYQLASAGSFLIVTDKGAPLVQELSRKGIHASVIGSLKDNNDKIIKNGEDVRYIDRPAPDEINKIRTGGYYERD